MLSLKNKQSINHYDLCFVLSCFTTVSPKKTRETQRVLKKALIKRQENSEDIIFNSSLKLDVSSKK